MVKEISSRTERFGAVRSSSFSDTEQVSVKDAFLVFKSPYDRGAYGVCSRFTPKDHKSHFAKHDF